MSFVSNPPAFYAEVVIKRVSAQGEMLEFNPIWLRWFIDLAKTLNGLQAGTQVFGDVLVSTINKVTITPPLVSATLTIANLKTLTVNDTSTIGTTGIVFANSGSLVMGASKTLTANNSITLAGTDGTVMTFPATNASVARTDAVQSFAGLQTANVKVASAGGNQSSDGSAGLTGTLTTASLVGKTLTFKDGIITDFA